MHLAQEVDALDGPDEAGDSDQEAFGGVGEVSGEGAGELELRG